MSLQALISLLNRAALLPLLACTSTLLHSALHFRAPLFFRQLRPRTLSALRGNQRAFFLADTLPTFAASVFCARGRLAALDN
jgi:hypothetical protein